MKKMWAKLSGALCATLALGALVSCGNDAKNKDKGENGGSSSGETGGQTGGSTGGSSEGTGGQAGGSTGGSDNNTGGRAPKLFLAGDSTVKTYSDSQFIGGWGQYLDLFLDDSITVKNCANGGRSSRSFINEGRLYKNVGSTYKFSENNGVAIEDEIESGDFLFVQFGHNDDATKAGNTLIDRMVPLGAPNANGIYPTTPGVKSTGISNAVKEAMHGVANEEAKITEFEATYPKYGESYYAYDCGGTYKWFLKQYVDFAREKGATPVLVTPVARVHFSGTEIVGGPGYHGENFAYVEAVRQLAQEEDCLLIDLFDDSKRMLETATPTDSDFLMALVDTNNKNELTGDWPSGYDAAYKNPAAGYSKMEGTHYNKFGAFVEAGFVAEAIKTSTEKKNGGKESFDFASKVNSKPEKYVEAPGKMDAAKASAVLDLVKAINLVENVSAADVVALINNLPAVSTITEANYLQVLEEVKLVEKQYLKVAASDKANVTNYSNVAEVKAKIDDIKASIKPTSVTVIDFAGLTQTSYFGDATGTSNYTDALNTLLTTGAVSFTLHGSGTKSDGTNKTINVGSATKEVTLSDIKYTFTKSISPSGSKKEGYIEFSVTGKCKISVVGSSTGDDARVFGLYDTTDAEVQTVQNGSKSDVKACKFAEYVTAGTYRIASTNKGCYIYGIIIEYYA